MFDKTRKEIKEFAEAMESIMKRHDGTKGDSWKTVSIKHLEECLEREFEEWKSDKKTVIGKREVIDVANICMMLFHRYSKCED